MFAVDVDLSDARGLTCRFDIFFFRELEEPGLLQKILLKKNKFTQELYSRIKQKEGRVR